jgi:proline iminopeptidase
MKNTIYLAILATFLLLTSCDNNAIQETTKNCDYNNFTTPGDFQQAGVQMITLNSGHKVWTKRIGNNPDMKVLLLHGGPALTHEYMECFESFFPQAGIEFYHYDQLGSHYSDKPENDSLWTIDRFVEEVEEVRQELGLDKDNFYILGNSWGGILGMEYALKYQQHMKGLLVSHMTADFDKYEAYNAKLRSKMRKSLTDSLDSYEQKEDYHNQEYLDLVFNEYYTQHICRFAPEDWPEPVLRSFGHINQHVYEYMQGPSEFVPGGILKHWSVWDDLKTLSVPTLMIGSKYDTMNPDEMKEMATLVQNGRSLHCENGSHLAMWDEQDFYMEGVIDFIKDVNDGSFLE